MLRLIESLRGDFRHYHHEQVRRADSSHDGHRGSSRKRGDHLPPTFPDRNLIDVFGARHLNSELRI